MCPQSDTFSGPGDGEKGAWDGMGLPALEVKGGAVHWGDKEAPQDITTSPLPTWPQTSSLLKPPICQLLPFFTQCPWALETARANSAPQPATPWGSWGPQICPLLPSEPRQCFALTQQLLNRWCLPPPPPPLRGHHLLPH